MVSSVLNGFINTSVDVFVIEFLSNNKSRTAVKTLAPAISAAMAVQAVNGTAILRIVIHFFVSCFDHNATAATAFLFLLPVPTATNCFPILCSSLSQL